jgi:hypothetical protein
MSARWDEDTRPPAVLDDAGSVLLWLLVAFMAVTVAGLSIGLLP